MTPRITVVGSINLDLVANCERLPRVGEAVSGSCFLVSHARGRRASGLERACAAGALGASRFGAQPSLPTADEVDAIVNV